MIKKYLLKHKNNEVLEFEMDEEKYILLGVNNIINKERLPFSLVYKENMAHCIVQLDTWIKGRGLTESRKDLNEIKKLFKTNEKNELIVKSYGLNVTDHFWLHEKDKNVKWENVNYFDNLFDEIKVGNNVDFSIDNEVKTPSPNFCVDGSIVKRWIINEKGERVLLKGSRYGIMQEPFNELIASKIMDEFKIKHVSYKLKRTKDNIPYSECKTMSDQDHEYINANWVIGLEDYGLKDIYDHYIEICKRYGINDVKERVDEMIAIDFIIGNDDRHRGNFGILRNANNLEWVEVAKIFDNGNSLFFDKSDYDIENFGIDSLGKSFGDSNRLQLDVIDYPQWYNNSAKNRITDIMGCCLNYNERLSSKRKDKIIKVVEERLNIFENKIKSKIKKSTPGINYNNNTKIATR